MPNYNYRNNDYMRCGQCQRPVMPPPQRGECDHAVRLDESPKTACTYDPLNGFPIAMAYILWQEFKNLYPSEKGFCHGTIFEELDKPFLSKGGCCK